jgi:leader peptidase (prepilin peptidase)/N-methyltransferase
VITVAAGAGTPAWLVLLFAGAGAVVGTLTGRQLGTGGYRIASDAAAAPPLAPWWPAPVLAVLWGFLAWRIGDAAGWAVLPAYLFFAWLTVCLVWTDLDVHRLPDGLVLPAYPALLALLAAASVGARDWRPLVGALVSMAVVYGLYLVMALVSPGSLGYGDVKLAGLIGLALGWLGPGRVLLGVLVGFVLGGLAALVLLVAQRAGLKSHIAFGPAMLVGALAALALEFQIVTAAPGP